MGNRLNAALAALFLLFHLIQGMPLDPTSPLERAVLEKRQTPPPSQPNTCPTPPAHAASQAYHIHQCVPMEGAKKHIKSECRGHGTVRVYCGVPIVGIQQFVDVPCQFDEFCFIDRGTNCLGWENERMDACVRDLVPGNMNTQHNCYGTAYINIPLGAHLLHAHTAGAKGDWKDLQSGRGATNRNWFDEILNGPAVYALRVIVPCTTRIYFSLFYIK